MKKFDAIYYFIIACVDFVLAYWFANFLYQLVFDPNFKYNPNSVGTAFASTSILFAILGIQNITRLISKNNTKL